MGAFASWKDIVNGEHLLLTRQGVENETPTNRVELGEKKNDLYDTFLHIREVEGLHGFQSEELSNKEGS